MQKSSKVILKLCFFFWK